MKSESPPQGPWRDFFHLVQLLRFPLLSSIFAALVFGLPDQSIDSYISIAQNLRLAKPWLHLTDTTRLVTGVVLVAALVSVAVLGIALWLACHGLLTSRGDDNHGRWARMFRLWALPLVVALPAIGLTLGAIRGAIQIPAEKVSAALMAARDVSPGLAQDIIRSAFDPTLPYLIGGLAGVLTLLLLLVVVVVERGHASRSVGGMGAFPGVDRRLLLVALCLLLLIALAAWSVRTAQTLGSVAIFALFMAALTLVGGFLDKRSRLSGIPILGLLIIWAIGLAAIGINDNHQVRLAYEAQSTPSGQSLPTTPTVGAAFEEWYRSRADKAAYHERGLRYPIYVVAAQGGGIYAAYHAAVFLAGMQDECPTFRKHLFAISSVSGGSVGAAMFHALLKGEPLRDDKCSANLPPTLSDRTEEALRKDLLAPLVAAFLVPDFLQRFLPYAFPQLDRARALERALEASLEGVIPAGSANPLSARFAEHWRPQSNEPALLMGTTEVGTGRVRVLSPFSLPSKDIKLFGLDQGYERLSVSTAAVLSARFPWITPAAWVTEQQIRNGQPHTVKVRLVDGGIFENPVLPSPWKLFALWSRRHCGFKYLTRST